MDRCQSWDPTASKKNWLDYVPGPSPGSQTVQNCHRAGLGREGVDNPRRRDPSVGIAAMARFYFTFCDTHQADKSKPRRTCQEGAMGGDEAAMHPVVGACGERHEDRVGDPRRVRAEHVARLGAFPIKKNMMKN